MGHRHYTSKDTNRYVKYSGLFFVGTVIIAFSLPIISKLFIFDYYPFHPLILVILSAVFFIIYTILGVGMVIVEFIAQIHKIKPDHFCEKCNPKDSCDS